VLISFTDSIVLNKPPDTATSPTRSEASSAASSAEDTSMQESFFHAAASSPNFPTNISDIQFDQDSGFDIRPALAQQQRRHFQADMVTSDLNSLFEDTRIVAPARSSRSGQSPKLRDLLSPGSIMDTRENSMGLSSPRMGNLTPRMTTATTTMTMNSPAMSISGMLTPKLEHFSMEMGNDQSLHEEIEEIIRPPPPSPSEYWMSVRGPVQMSRSPSPLDTQPTVLAGSPEYLIGRFDRYTCGILSVKDGPNENPWRTLVWPLTHDSPALYHAVISMTAFHNSKDRPSLRVEGMEHMRYSIRSLGTAIQRMPATTALATTLALAFTESWDQHVSTGIEHLKGAKILVNKALQEHYKHPRKGIELARLKFLCNTWVYMDVIARLTSVDDSDSKSPDIDQMLTPLNSSFPNNRPEIDPLMGSASTLFPLIGHAASLCRQVLNSAKNSISTISRANELKELIERWKPSPFYETPQDPYSDIQHALQTAEAYRYATLLHLHQAVPEIPSMTSAELARQVLIKLATVPISSRLVIVQIYPLLAAGCEVETTEDREWVKERWESMVQRMWIGNVDRCWEVMQEVWSRRDQAAEKKREVARRRMSAVGLRGQKEGLESGHGGTSFTEILGEGDKERRYSTGSGYEEGIDRSRRLSTEEMDVDVTVRGRAHWLGVMRERNWESTFVCLLFNFGPIFMVLATDFELQFFLANILDHFLRPKTISRSTKLTSLSWYIIICPHAPFGTFSSPKATPPIAPI
jgi:hypothetical protein